MSKSRRSLIRSSLERLRQLWFRRETVRREMRRQLGQTFEALEPRLTMTISSPLPPIFPAANSHIHPTLSIFLDGQQVVIPAGIGLNGGAASPHTHDYTGTLHVGEASTVGTDTSGSASRNVTLDDFFDVWASTSLTGATVRNVNARLDTDATDGTAAPRIMDKTVDSTHVLRMYVKEASDSAPQLEYDSSSSSNNVARPELYVPRDGDKIYLVYEKSTQAVDSPSFDTISSQNVLGGAPTWLGINGFDPTGGTLTYTVSVANPNLLQATIQQNASGPGANNKSLVINASSSALEGGYGQMVFQLFDNLAPNTTSHIETLVNNGEFATSSSFYRISHLGDGSDFVIQGGPSDSSSSLGNFDDEYNTNLQFTTAGLLAMAKSTDDTNDSQLFITGGPARFLDFQHSIFGVLTEGNAVRNAIQQSRTSGDGAPPQPITIESAQIITDNQNAALQLKAAEGASGSTTVTLTVSDQQGHTYTQTFNVTISPDTANSAPFLNPIAPITGVTGQPITVQLSAQDAENNPLFFDATKPSGETVNYTVNTNSSTGLVTITPPAGFSGTFHVSMGVRGATTTTTSDQFDLQNVLVTVGPAAPSGIDLVATSDSGSSNSDNTTNASSLDFQVSGLTVGATVKLMKGSTVLAQGVATATTMTLNVPNAATALGQGASDITATQTVSGQTSPVSTALKVTYDNVNPTITSTAPTAAQVGFNLSYDAQTSEEGGTSGLTYSLTNAPTGAAINASTGVLAWSPSSTQTGNQSFNIVATDAAGNVATQAVTVNVGTALVDLTLTITKPDGSALTTLSPGQDFLLHIFAKDLRTANAQGVFAIYQDITFDGTKATVTGPVNYTTTYNSGQSGTTTTAGVIDEIGSFGGTQPLGASLREVLSIPMRATASGTLVFTGNEADTHPAHDVLIYGQDGGVPTAQIHYGAVSIEVGSTFNAVNDAFNATEDTSNTTFNPLANDASIGGASNTLTISEVTQGNHGGTISIASDSKTIRYTPAANFVGTETFTYTAKNQSNETHVATVTMTVADVNDPPAAVNDSLSATKNSTGNVLNVLANDTGGVDTGETLLVTAVGTGSQGGTITIGANGANIVYTPKANFSGNETFTYTISDRATGGLTSQATVTVNVSGLTATNDSGSGFTVTEDSSATTIDVLANDALDPQVGGTLTVTAVGTTDKGGTVTITQNGTRLSYTPAANFQGTEKFTYTISDGQGHNATATVSMTVTNTNDPPVAANDTLTAFKDSTTSFDVLANDNSGPDPTETLTLTAISTAPQHGTATIVSGKVQYVPTTGYTGTDSFVYTITDATGATATATANITVQDFQPSSLGGLVYFDVNNNGVRDVGELPIVGVTITLTGTATAGSSTSVNQTIRTAEDGSYKFENLAPGTYQIKQTQPQFVIDGKVVAGSQGGTATTNQIAMTLVQNTTGTNNNFGELGRQLSTISLRDFFSSTSRNYAHASFDSNGAELWHSVSGSAWTGTSNTFSLLSNQSQIKLDTTNSLSQTSSKTVATNLPVYLSGQTSANRLYYIPAGGSNGGGGSTPPTNLPPVSAADTYSTAVGAVLTVTSTNGVLKNDSDPEGKTLAATVVTQPAHGTLNFNTDGTFTYTPASGFNGQDTFTYRATDGTNQGNVTTVTINVGNVAPTAVADTFTATEDTILTITAANGVLKNDTDPENGTLTATIVTQPTKGTITLASNGSFTYVPTANLNGADTFTYKANDGTNDSAVVTVTINITAVNDSPVAVADTFSTPKDTALNVTTSPNLLSNDTDADGQTLTVSTTPVSNVAHGSLTLSANGNFTYTPQTGYTGPDSFTYQVSDGTATATGTVTINVTGPVNHAPIAQGDSYNVDEDGTLNVSASNGVLSNDTDEDAGTTLTAINATQPAHGTVTLNTNGSFTYTPNGNYAGPDSFTYQASDGVNTSNAIVVSITVNAANDAPVGVADSYRVTPNTQLTVNAANGVLKNDSDIDSANLTVAVASNTTHGTLTLAADGSFTYQPNSTFTGTDTFTYTVSDDASPAGQSAPVTVQLVVNTAPVANNDNYSTSEDTPFTISAPGLLSNDADINSDPLTAGIASQPTHGTVTLNANGSFTYTPNADFNGTDTFRYQVTDGISTSTPATVTITVNAVNDAPERTAGSLTTISVEADSANSTAVSLGLSALDYGPGGDTDEAGQTLTYKITNVPSFIQLFKADGTTQVTANQTVTLEELRGLTYKTLAGVTGGGSITFTVQDTGGTANGGIDTLTENLTVTVGVNDQPVRTAGTVTPVAVNEDSNNTTAVTLDLTGLTYSPGGGSNESSQTLTFKLINIPAFVTIIKADGTTAVTANTTLTLAELQGLKYKTVADAFGTGNITWSIQDDGGTANGAIDTLTETLAITVNSVNDIPVRTSSAPASISVAEDIATSTAVSLGLTTLAYGPGDGSSEASQTLTYKITSIPSFISVVKADGTTAVSANSTLTLAELQGLKYKTLDNANGTANLTWTVQDTGGTANGGVDTLTQTLSITVNALNDAPVRTAGTTTAISVPEDSATSTAATLGLTALAYGPGGGSDEASQTLTYKITAIPTFVNIFKADGTTLVVLNDTLTLAELRGLKYKTVANAIGAGNLIWSVKDTGGTTGGGVDTLTQSISITVTPVNDIPALIDGSVTPIQVAGDSANTTAASLGLSNVTYGPGGGTDESSQTLTIKITDIPSFISVFETDGTTAVTENQLLTLAQLRGLRYKTVSGAAGAGQITWTVQDSGGSASGGVDTLTQNQVITVGVNDAPIRSAGSPAAINVAEDSSNTTAVSLGLTTVTYSPGPSDESSQTVTIQITSIPSFISVFKTDGITAVAANDTLTLAELQGLKYKTLANANGAGNITWTVKDTGGTANGGSDTLTETLAVNVNAVNDAPLRSAGTVTAISVNEDSSTTTAVTLGLSALTYGNGGGSDEASQTLTYKVTSIPAFVSLFKADGITAVTVNSTLTLAEFQGLKYKTVANAIGSGNITWSVQDSGGTASGGIDTLTETLAISVLASNDAPALTSAAPSPVSVNEDSANSTAAALGLTALAYSKGGGSDEDSQTLTYKITAIPSFISLFKSDGTTQVIANDLVSLAELQGLKYKTQANVSGGGNLTWTVHDDGGTANSGIDTLAQTLSITVNAVNDVPARTAGTPAAVSTTEDAANTTAASLGLSGLTYDAVEGGQALTYKIASIPSFITLVKADGITVVGTDDTLTLADLQGLKYKTVANAFGTDSLTWTVHDDGGTANGGIDTLTETLSVTVLSVNDVPVQTAGTVTNLTINEDRNNTIAETLGLAGLTYSPGGGTPEAGQTLTYTISIIPGFVKLYKADGSTQVNVDDAISPTELQGLKYKTIANANGNGDISWIVKDNGGVANSGVDSLTQTLTVTVNLVNDAPTLTAGTVSDLTVDEDHANTVAQSLGLAAVTYGPGGGTEEGGQTLTYTIGTIPDFIKLYKEDGLTEVSAAASLSSAELQGLKYKTIADVSGTGDITWIVKDNGGVANGGVDSFTETLSVNVQAVNDVPVLTAGTVAGITVDEDQFNTTAQTLGLAGLTYGPGGGTDESLQNLTYKITAIPSLVILVMEDGTTAVNVGDELSLTELRGLKFNTVLDANGAGDITWEVKDDGTTINGGVDTLTQSLTITVNPVEGEFEGEANDAALMMLLADGEDWSHIHDSDDWQNAIDQSFADMV